MSNSTFKAKLIIILGMHRSGTSVLSGCLNLLGADLGKNVMPADDANPKGYFENHDLVSIHEILLRDLGCRWDMVGSLPDNWLNTQAVTNTKKKISRFLDREFSNSSVCSLKDPRMSIFLPMWEQIFQEKMIIPNIIQIIRHPFEVASSLKKRDGFDLSKGHLLWLNHIRSIFTFIKDKKYCLLTYDQLLSDPAAFLERTNIELDINFPVTIQEAYYKILNFIEPQLKHYTVSVDDSSAYAPYARIYDLLTQNNNAPTSLDEKIFSVENKITPKSNQYIEKQYSPTISNIEIEIIDKEISKNTFFLDHSLSIIGKHEREELECEIQRHKKLLAVDQSGKTLYAQVYFPSEKPHTYQENHENIFILAPEEWEKIIIDIPNSTLIAKNPLRLDPLNTIGIINIATIKIYDKLTKDIFWSASKAEHFQTIQIIQDVYILSDNDGLLLLSLGNDPILHLPIIPNLPDKPLAVELWLKVSQNIFSLKDILDKQKSDLAIKQDAFDHICAEMRTMKNKFDEQSQLFTTAEEKLKSHALCRIQINDLLEQLSASIKEGGRIFRVGDEKEPGKQSS